MSDHTIMIIWVVKIFLVQFFCVFLPMASLTWWMWVWMNSGSWWWIGRPGVLRFMGSQRVGHDWATELNWTERLSLGKAMAFHPSTLAWKIPWMEEPGGLQSMRSLRVGHTERLHFHFSLSCTGEGNGNPLQWSCLENPRDRGSLVGCHLWGRTESDTTKVT